MRTFELNRTIFSNLEPEADSNSSPSPNLSPVQLSGESLPERHPVDLLRFVGGEATHCMRLGSM